MKGCQDFFKEWSNFPLLFLSCYLFVGPFKRNLMTPFSVFYSVSHTHSYAWPVIMSFVLFLFRWLVNAWMGECDRFLSPQSLIDYIHHLTISYILLNSNYMVDVIREWGDEKHKRLNGLRLFPYEFIYLPMHNGLLFLCICMHG